MVVALSGLGGDELFGGYPSFADVPRLSRLLGPLGFVPRGLRGALGGALAWLLSAGRDAVFHQKLTDMLRAGPDPVALALQRRRCFSDAQIARLLGSGTPAPPSGFLQPGQLDDLPLSSADAISRISLLESRFYMGNTLLPVGDATSMAHGLEIRVPMLDRPMLELAYRLPGGVRLPEGKADKALLRRAFPDLLRPELLQQSKRGFVIPVKRWMQGALRPVCEAALDTLMQHDAFQAEAVSQIWQQFQRRPESPLWSRVWTLVALGHYLQRTHDSLIQS